MLEDNLRSLSVTLKREDESEQEAFERVQRSTYITTFRHDEDSPFYRVDSRFGKVILSVNTAHPFYTKLYEPLPKLMRVAADERDATADEDPLPSDVGNQDYANALTTLQLLLLSLGRTQSDMVASNPDNQRTFDTLRKQWSMNLENQLAGL